jgi:hypothetical protein
MRRGSRAVLWSTRRCSGAHHARKQVGVRGEGNSDAAKRIWLPPSASPIAACRHRLLAPARSDKCMLQAVTPHGTYPHPWNGAVIPSVNAIQRVSPSVSALVRAPLRFIANRTASSHASRCLWRLPPFCRANFQYLSSPLRPLANRFCSCTIKHRPTVLSAIGCPLRSEVRLKRVLFVRPNVARYDWPKHARGCPNTV